MGGWVVDFRGTCLGCGDPLTGRQVKWCAKSGMGWQKICSVAWHNPSLLTGPLLRLQQGLCGVCCRPLEGKDLHRMEVDHVVPRSHGGALTVENLRTTHRECNQLKKARSLGETRLRMGLTDTEILRRLAGADAATVALLRPPRLTDVVMPVAAAPVAAPWTPEHPRLF